MPGSLLAIGYASLLLLLMRRMRFYSTVPRLPWSTLSVIFILKVLAGTVLWWIYTYTYPDRLTADVFKYYDDSAVMYAALWEEPMDYLQMLSGFRNDTPYFTEKYYMHMNNWFRQYESNVYNDSHTMIRFNALVRLFSFGEFHVHTVMAAFLALTGMVGLYRAFVAHLPGRETALMAAIFLIPSVLLWASSVIKESLLFFGLGIMLHQVFRLREGRVAASGVAALAGSILLLFYLKFYVLMSMMPALALYLICKGRSLKYVFLWAVLIYGSSALLALNLHHIDPGYDVLGLLAMKQRDFIGLAEHTHSGSFVMPPILSPAIGSFLVNAPYALYITLLGPMIHFSGILGTFSALENVCLLAVLIFLLLHIGSVRTIDMALLISLIGYVVLLALVIGWTTPVIGAIVRYRTPFLPFLMIIGLLLLDHEKLLRRWPALKRLVSG